MRLSYTHGRMDAWTLAHASDACQTHGRIEEQAEGGRPDPAPQPAARSTSEGCCFELLYVHVTSEF